MNISLNVSGFLTPYDFESLTVGVAAVGLTATKYHPAAQAGDARIVIITCEGRVRFRWDADPTDAIGHTLNDGDTLTLSGFSNISKIKFIRHSGEVADATLRVSYLR